MSTAICADWYSAEELNVPEAIADWLMEPASMTQRFERCCRKVSVEPIFEGFIDADLISHERQQLPDSERYWLREIILYGDGIPWLLGRTVIPEQTLNGPELALTELGDVPLGRYLFSRAALSRDFIEVTYLQQLWARRSRLCLSGKPLLLTEVFLPAAPIYQANHASVRA